MNDTIHKVEEFHNFPFEKISKDTEMKTWSYGSGGYGLPDGTLTIGVFKNEKDIDQDIWVLPECINLIVRNIFKHGKEEAINQVRNHIYGLANVLGFEIE